MKVCSMCRGTGFVSDDICLGCEGEGIESSPITFIKGNKVNHRSKMDYNEFQKKKEKTIKMDKKNATRGE